MKRTARFTAPLVEGHKGVTAVIVPFDPEAVWNAKPTALDARRHGWLVHGTMNGVTFDGFIGFRWSRFFLLVDEALREAAKVVVGDTLSFVVKPTATERALRIAQQQALKTTAPSKPRADVVVPRRKPPRR